MRCRRPRAEELDVNSTELELVCPACGSAERCADSQMLARLRSLGLMRRDAKPDPGMVRELFRSSANRFSCHDCDHLGLTVREPIDDEWGTVKVCDRCRGRIPTERLELYPDATRCAACEAAAGPAGTEDREFCPRCGDLLKVQLRRSGVTRYELVCPSCGRR